MAFSMIMRLVQYESPDEEIAMGPFQDDDDRLEDSSEEEDEVRCDALNDVILQKTWLVWLFTCHRDIAYSIGAWLRCAHFADIEFREINESYWHSTYGIMSDTRMAIQKVKKGWDDLLRESNIYSDDELKWYGQFIKGYDHLVRNKTMRIGIVHNYYASDTDIMLETDTSLRVHNEYITFKDKHYASLVVVMDTGINADAAIRFARTLDRSNLREDTLPSIRTYNEEYCSVCQARACNQQYTGSHGCDCTQAVICMDGCLCDCHCVQLKVFPSL